MKTVGLRSLYKTAPTLTEQVLVTYDGEVIGRYIPNGAGSDATLGSATESIRALRQAERDTFGFSRPAPKPGSKK
jgi:ABC-type lipopolysaccharide export system ATPase subunit